MRFKANPHAIPELGKTREMVAMLEDVATEATAKVRSIAPVDRTSPHYRDMIHPDAAVENGQALGRVNAHKDTSGLIEFGTEDTPTFAPLRRGFEMLGFRLKGSR